MDGTISHWTDRPSLVGAEVWRLSNSVKKHKAARVLPHQQPKDELAQDEIHIIQWGEKAFKISVIKILIH